MPDSPEPFRDSSALAEELSATLEVSATRFSSVIATGMKRAIADGYTLDRVLRQAALSISNSALRAGLRPLSNLVGQGANAVLGSLGGAVGGGIAGVATKVMPFAEGGVIGAPTAFGMTGGRVGLMGEAGREAVLPLARGSDGRLGVALEGTGRGAGTTINVSIATPDPEAFQRSEQQVTAMLARAVARGRRGL
ncbi:phage tail tape measure protein [Acuticoccus sediminis]|uniref:phage tail tape measure protein n=1 Tax=Acuticoccus sediminis TaxID=2184697 RepID=UPI001CFCD261|nr:phage tail tape measure protein [Acuticoccus sediminis]